MAILKFRNVGITALAACVPKKISSNYNLEGLIPKDTLLKVINFIGIKEKRIADENVCSSDLCFKAAQQLIKDNNTDKSQIDMVLFLSQTPDYIIPTTAAGLQHRIGLSTSTACIDLSLACSGFIYSLSTAFSFALNPGINKILLLVGETMSKVVNKRDKINYPLFGDAGTACIVEKGNFPESTFILNSDGSGINSVQVPFGGFRNPVTADSLIDKEREDGNIRKDIDLTMDGIDTFNHAIYEIPKIVKQIFKESKTEIEDMDYFVSHQANKFMIDHIAKRLKIPKDKVPYCIEKFGNTSGASIPLTIVSELENKIPGKKCLILSGIGAGWTYAAANITTNNLKISKLTEY